MGPHLSPLMVGCGHLEGEGKTPCTNISFFVMLVACARGDPAGVQAVICKWRASAGIALGAVLDSSSRDEEAIERVVAMLLPYCESSACTAVLQKAVLRARVATVRMLLDAGAQPTIHALETAVANGFADICALLLSCTSMDPRQGAGERMVVWAASYADPSVLSSLLAWRGPHGQYLCANAHDDAALRVAASMGHLRTVQALLAWRGSAGEFVDAAARDGVVIARAAKRGHTAVVACLLAWTRKRS